MDQNDKRATHRTALNGMGIVEYQDRRLSIRTRDVSLGGSRIEIAAQCAPPVNATIRVFFSSLGMAARGLVRWVAEEDGGAAVLGLQFESVDFRPEECW
jgi:hypothetical protein